MLGLQNKQKTGKNILLFVTEYRPSVPNLKTILMSKWHLIENQPLLREIYKDPPLLSYRKERSLKNVLVHCKSKALKVMYFLSRPIGVVVGLSSLFYHHGVSKKMLHTSLTFLQPHLTHYMLGSLLCGFWPCGLLENFPRQQPCYLKLFYM